MSLLLQKLRSSSRSGVNKAHAGLLLVLITIAVSGCNPPAEKNVPTAAKAASQSLNLDEAPVLSDADSALVKAAGPASEADKVWRELQKSMQPPGYPPEWQTTQPTKEQVAEFEKKNGVIAAEAAGKARQFYVKYPKDERAEEARRREYDLLKVAIDLGHTNSLTRIDALEEERLKDPALTPDDRITLRVQQIQRIMSTATEGTLTNALGRVEKAVRTLQADYPERPELAGLSASLAEIWFDRGDAQKSRLLAEEVMKSKAEADSKETASMLLKKISHLGKPLAIKVPALDGSEIDLQKLKGKVVLVDFWATWCGPCIKALPEVKSVYQKFHDKGFDVVGISYDDDKEAVQQLVSAEKIPWPQHFDEANAGKRFGEEFGVIKLPTMWLVDKKGILRELGAQRDLAEKVEKLLAEK